MGKFNLCLNYKKKNKRWTKGQSSSSNPEIKKFRNQAQSQFFKQNLGFVNLTTDILKKYDAIQGIQNHTDNSVIQETKTSTNGNTFASEWSNCSNVTFDRFFNYYQSNSKLHKEMLAILATITDLIKEKQGSESSTEYFAGLITMLKIADSKESTSAILSLLNMGMKTVPKNILMLQFSETSHILLEILTKHASKDNFFILRHCISCLSYLLKIQEPIVWMNSSTLQILDIFLSFTIHSKPKLRKAAQHAISSILKTRDTMQKDNPVFHPAVPRIAKHCIAQIEITNQPGQITNTLHILTLLKNIVHQFPKSFVKILCKELLSIMALNNVLITTCCFQVFYHLFLSKPIDAILPSQLNAQIINALYDYQPALGDIQPMLAWLAVMQEAYCNLVLYFPELCAINIPRIIERCTELWLSDKDDIRIGTSHTLKVLFETCITPICQNEELSLKCRPILIKIIQLIQQAIKYQYISAWHHIFHLTSLLFKTIGPICQNESIEILKNLAELKDSYSFAFTTEIEFAIGAAIKALGPETVLAAIPLQIGHDINLNRSWLLPILQDCLSHSSLEFYIDHLLPLADFCEEKYKSLTKNNDIIEAHSYELLMIQIWALLPNFCNNAPDIKKNFKKIAKILGIIINDKKNIRLPIMASLRKLINKSIENSNADDIEELSGFAKNYLPILFNLYTIKPVGSDEEGHRLSCYETIKLYLKITNEHLVAELFDKALENLSKSNETDFFKESIFDLIRLICQFTDITRVKILYEKCVPLFLDKKQKEQKKAYRILEEICRSENKTCRCFITENQELIQKILTKSFSTVQNLSKGVRIRCITHLIKNHPQLENTKFLNAIIPEAVMGIKELNEKCRSSSYILINTIAEKLKGKEVFEKYINILISGFSNTTSYCSASLFALSSVVYHYNDSMSKQCITNIFDHSCSFIMQPTREIVESALTFIKVYLLIMSTQTIAPSILKIIEALTSMIDDCKKHFRLKVRDIMTKLIRKFGFHIIYNMVPNSDQMMHKRLKNIRKIENKKKKFKEQNAYKKKNENNIEFDIKKKSKSVEEILADSDPEFDNNDKIKSIETKKNKLKMKTWIQENEYNIVDFMDTTVPKYISTTNLNKKILITKTKDNNHDLKIAEDGRLIIMDLMDNEINNEKIIKKNKIPFIGCETENYISNLDDIKSIKSSKSSIPLQRKRKFSSSAESMISNTNSLVSNHKDNNLGIYRSLKVCKKEKEPGEEYRSKKGFGDVKKKDKPDPYAYIPLTSTLTQRKIMNTYILKNLSCNKQKKRCSKEIKK